LAKHYFFFQLVLLVYLTNTENINKYLLPSISQVASPDVGRMGIEILSFTIKDVYDSVEYLESLGRAQTANVKRDADIGVAEANRDAGIRVNFADYI